MTNWLTVISWQLFIPIAIEELNISLCRLRWTAFRKTITSKKTTGWHWEKVNKRKKTDKRVPFWILFPSKKIYKDKNNKWKESSSYDVPAALKGSNFCTQVDIEIICKSCGLRIRWKCHESKWEKSARGSVRWKWHGTKQRQLFSVLIINGNEMRYVRLVGEWIKRRRGGKCNQLSWLQMKWNGKERRDR